MTQETVQIQFDFGNEITIVEQPSKRQTDNFVFEMMDLVSAPVLTFSQSWADAIPKHLIQDIRTSRFLSGFAKEQMATIPEVVAYIMTRTYESPMNHEWTQIYLWCGVAYQKLYRQKTDEDFEDIFPPRDLSEYEQGLLKRLRVWIYEKRREIVKQRIKASN